MAEISIFDIMILTRMNNLCLNEGTQYEMILCVVHRLGFLFYCFIENTSNDTNYNSWMLRDKTMDILGPNYDKHNDHSSHLYITKVWILPNVLNKDFIGPQSL